MRIGVLAIIFSLTISSCDFGRRHYRNDGISFQLPEGFRIVEDSFFESGTHYVSIEPKRKKEHGVILLTWEQDSVDLYKYLDIYLNSVLKEYKSEEMESPIFSEIDSSSFAGHDAIFTFSDTNTEPIGGHRYWTFHCYYTTVMITVVFQEIQYKEIESSLKTIENSFKCFQN